MKKVLLSLLPFVALAVFTVLLRNGSFSPARYLEPWDKGYHTNFSDVRLQIVSLAMLAPSAHNTQPWKVRLDEGDPLRFLLYTDTNRLLPSTDPLSRQVLISQGAFLGIVEMAAKEAGYKAEIALFPEGDIDKAGSLKSIARKPVAEVRLKKKDVKSDPLFPYIFERSTVRTPYLDRPLTEGQKNALLSVEKPDNTRLKIIADSEDLAKVRDLAVRGLDIESRLEGPMNESRVLMRTDEYAKNRYRDGLTLAGQGASGIGLFFMQVFTSFFPTDLKTDGEFWRKAEGKRIAKTPVYLMIQTDDNGRSTQVRSGIYYLKLQLEAARLGMAMQPNMQALEEYPEMKEVFEGIHGEFAPKKRTIQMLVRLGVPAKKTLHSPRRDVTSVIAKDGPKKKEKKEKTEEKAGE